METITARFLETHHVIRLGDIARGASGSPRWRSALILGVGPLAFIAAVAGWQGSLMETAFLLGVILVLGLIATFFLLCLVFPLARQYEHPPGQEPEIEWSFSPERITLVSPRRSASGPWSDFHPITPSLYGFLVSLGSGPAHFIPFDAFETPEQIEALQQMIRDKMRVAPI